jgi:sortase A
VRYNQAEGIKAHMQGFDSKAQAGRGIVRQPLVWGGLLLLLVGAVALCPHVRATLPTSLTPETSPLRLALATAPATATALPAPAITATSCASPPPTASPTRTPARPIRLVIPAIDLDAPIIPVSWQPLEIDGRTMGTWELADTRAAGWHETSALLGEIGNTVLNGHNTTGGEVFRNLHRLSAGDAVFVYGKDTPDEMPFAYSVAEKLILPEGGEPLEVRIDNARYILATEDERLTLVTCHPYGSLRNRLIVIAYPEEDLARADE